MLDDAVAEIKRLSGDNDELRQTVDGIRQIIIPNKPPAIGEDIPNEDIVHDYFLRIFGMLSAPNERRRASANNNE
jgi:hypothetical protein